MLCCIYRKQPFPGGRTALPMPYLNLTYQVVSGWSRLKQEYTNESLNNYISINKFLKSTLRPPQRTCRKNQIMRLKLIDCNPLVHPIPSHILHAPCTTNCSNIDVRSVHSSSETLTAIAENKFRGNYATMCLLSYIHLLFSYLQYIHPPAQYIHIPSDAV